MTSFSSRRYLPTATSFAGSTRSAAITIEAVPAPNLALIRPSSSFKPSFPSQTSEGRASAVLIFLPALAAGLPVSFTGSGTRAASAPGSWAAAVAGSGSATFLALARIRSSLLGPFAAGSGVGMSTAPGSCAWGAAIFGGFSRVSSRASINPAAVRSAVISKVRRSIRSGPKTGIGTSRSTSPRYQGEAETFSPSIFFWSMMRPFRSACGVGGQPGM